MAESPNKSDTGVKNKSLRTWNAFFGPDPLEGRVNVLNPLPEKFQTPHKPHIQPQTPYPMNLTGTHQLLVPNWFYVQAFHQSAMAAVVTNSVHTEPVVYCKFCRQNGEEEKFYTSHPTSACQILANFLCDICGQKGHTVGHCKKNTGGSIVQKLREIDVTTNYGEPISFPVCPSNDC